LYRASPYEVWTAIEGYQDKEDSAESNVRNLAYIVYSVNVPKGKRMSIEKFWPMRTDEVSKPKGPLEVDKSLWESIQKQLKRKPKQKK
jgi:hypothetical protein